MKETKVYVDDETLMKCERYRHNSCPIIQAHDRELVKKVCEKIRLKFSDTRSHNWGIEQIELYDFLDQIQKEFEK